MAEWVTMGHLPALEHAGWALVRVQGREVAVFRVGDALHAMDDSCPHSGASPCAGQLDETGHVRCPAHGLRFRLSDGRMAGSSTGGECAVLAARVYPIRMSAGVIQLQLGE